MQDRSCPGVACNDGTAALTSDLTSFVVSGEFETGTFVTATAEITLQVGEPVLLLAANDDAIDVDAADTVNYVVTVSHLPYSYASTYKVASYIMKFENWANFCRFNSM